MSRKRTIKIPDEALQVLSMASQWDTSRDNKHLFQWIHNLPEIVRVIQTDSLMVHTIWTFTDGSIEHDITTPEDSEQTPMITVTIQWGRIGASFDILDDPDDTWTLSSIWIGEDTEPTHADWLLVCPAGIRML